MDAMKKLMKLHVGWINNERDITLWVLQECDWWEEDIMENFISSQAKGGVKKEWNVCEEDQSIYRKKVEDRVNWYL